MATQPHLRASVGLGACNEPGDVRLVQGLLNEKGADPAIHVDGIVGPRTLSAIRVFQSAFMSVPDLRVDPGGRTFTRLVAAPTLAPPAPPVIGEEWDGPSEKWPEEQKIRSLTPDMRKPVREVLADLRAQGFQARLYFAWRSVAVQAELVRKGHSTVSFSFHNAQRRDGTPNACAVDVIDSRWAWGAGAEASGFWRALGEAGKSRGLYWGGDWKRFRDVAHLQLYSNGDLSRVRGESGF
ncbi:MAG: M15 family metallopeptidase [Myxococcota bacterium]